MSLERTYQFCKTAKQLSGSSSIAQTILNSSLSIVFETQYAQVFNFRKFINFVRQHLLCYY